MHPKRFIAILVSCCLATAALPAAMNWMLDPTGLLHVAGFRAASVCAPGLRGDEVAVKTLAARFARPKTLLVGTSQVARGLDPDNLPPDWSEGGAFNLGISGANLRTLASVLPHVIHTGHTERIVLGLTPGLMLRKRMNPGSVSTPLNWTVKLLFTALLSRQAFEEGLRMLRTPSACSSSLSRFDGLRQPVQSRAPEARNEQIRLRIEEAVRSGTPTYGRSDLTALLDDLCGRGVKVFIAIMPHPVQWHMAYWETAGGWHWLERFKMDVVGAADALRKSGCSIPVQDFSTVELANYAAASKLPLFVDYVHFSPILGRDLLRTVTSGGAADADSAIGRTINSQNISAYLAAQRALMDEVFKDRR